MTKSHAAIVEADDETMQLSIAHERSSHAGSGAMGQTKTAAIRTAQEQQPTADAHLTPRRRESESGWGKREMRRRVAHRVGRDRESELVYEPAGRLLRREVRNAVD